MPGEPHRDSEPAAGLLPILRAFAAGRTDFDPGTLDEATIKDAVDSGLGALLAYVSRDCPGKAEAALAGTIRAADLTARMLTAEMLDAIGRILRASSTAGSVPVLLKGAAMALLHYPAPHLRTMGDIDVCLPPEEQPAFEAQLRALGFRQTSPLPAEFYARHHHSMPFWHPTWGVWVEVHTRLFPPQSPLADEPQFALPAIAPQLQTLEIGGFPARAMTNEMHMLYACSRWLEELDVERGVFPVLDVMLLARNGRRKFDWDRLFLMLDQLPSVATAAVHVMVAYLSRWRIVSLPQGILDNLAARDKHTNAASIWILHRVITMFLLERRAFGRFLTRLNVSIVWSTLLRRPTPVRNLIELPFQIAFPPGHPQRFNPAFLARRLRSFLRGAAN